MVSSGENSYIFFFYSHIVITYMSSLYDLHRQISIFILLFNTVEKYKFPVTKVDVYKDAL